MVRNGYNFERYRRCIQFPDETALPHSAVPVHNKTFVSQAAALLLGAFLFLDGIAESGDCVRASLEPAARLMHRRLQENPSLTVIAYSLLGDRAPASQKTPC